MSPPETHDQPFTLPADLPPDRLQPSGISFDSQRPDDIGALKHSSNIVPVPDAVGPYAYDVAVTTPERRPEELARAATLGEVLVVMASLRPEQRTAIRLHFGLDTRTPLAYAGIASELGIAYERAAGLVRSGMDTLRHLLETPPGMPDQTAAPSPPSTPEPSPPPEPPPEVIAEEPPAEPIAPEDTEPPAPLPASPPVVRAGTYSWSHSAPAVLNGPTVLFAADVGSQNAGRTVDFDVERYRAALRAERVSEERIADLTVLVFAGHTLANWLLAPGGTVGDIAGQRGVRRLCPLEPESKSVDWSQARIIALPASRNADAQLAYHTLALTGRLPPEETGELTVPKQVRALSGAAAGASLAIVTAGEFLSVPELTISFGAVGVAAVAAYIVAASRLDRQSRAVRNWQKEHGPIITVRRRQSLAERSPLLRRISGIISSR